MASESPQITSTPSFIADTQVINRDYSIHRHRPWRRYVTDFDALRSHEWEGEGTEAQPFVVTWLAKDPENPQVRYLSKLIRIYADMCVYRLGRVLTNGL
jgi:hypothetical protein